MTHLYFIINPEARNGRCRRVWMQVEQELRNLDINYFAFFSKYNGHAKQLAESVVKKSSNELINVIVVGGDGTVHEVLNGVANHRNVQLGFIPGGSGNDFSRGFNIPKDPTAALHILLRRMKREAVSVDIGLITSENDKPIYFINSMGVGFDALISQEANSSKLKKWLNRFSLGNLVYVFLLLRRLFTYKCERVRLTIDGEVYKFNSTWFVTIANQPFYGGGMKIAPTAVTNDGMLNIIVVQNISRIKLLAVFLSVFWGRHLKYKEVYHFMGSEITIQCGRPLPAHADGEQIGTSPVNISVIPNGIGIITRGMNYIKMNEDRLANIIEE